MSLRKLWSTFIDMPGFKHRKKLPGLWVKYIHIRMLLGANIHAATKIAVFKTFNKIVWIQNDLMIYVGR